MDQQGPDSDQLTRGRLNRGGSKPVLEVYLGAIFIASGGQLSAEVIAQTILHEFYHSSPKGTREYFQFEADLEEGRRAKVKNANNPFSPLGDLPVFEDPGYFYREHEINARDFARDVLNFKK